MLAFGSTASARVTCSPHCESPSLRRARSEVTDALESRTAKILDDNPDLKKQWTSLIPQGKMGQPEDLMGAVTFLSSDASGYVTGAFVRRCGGQAGPGGDPTCSTGLEMSSLRCARQDPGFGGSPKRRSGSQHHRRHRDMYRAAVARAMSAPHRSSLHRPLSPTRITGTDEAHASRGRFTRRVCKTHRPLPHAPRSADGVLRRRSAG
jgi:hypothetical protein